MSVKLPVWVVIFVGLAAAPFLLVIILVRFLVGAVKVVRAVGWIWSVHRDGIICPAGHVRLISPSDRWTCPDCKAVFQGTPPYLPCPLCAGAAKGHGWSLPAFIDCECGLSVSIPQIPPVVVWLFDRGGHHSASARRFEEDFDHG